MYGYRRESGGCATWDAMPRRHARTLGVKKKAIASASPRGQFEHILAEILVSGEQAPNPEGVLQTIEERSWRRRFDRSDASDLILAAIGAGR